VLACTIGALIFSFCLTFALVRFTEGSIIQIALTMFIVLEGTDGCGKSTQSELLQQFFTKKGVAVHAYHFPVLENSGVFGELIAQYLRGELGDMTTLPPKLIGVLYAANRRDLQEQMRAELQAGTVLIADRYFASNLAYAAAKLHDDEARNELIHWLLRVDLQDFQNIEPDLTLFFDAPLNFSMRINEQRKVSTAPSRSYTAGKQDIHEAKLEYQQEVQNVYRALGNYLANYHTIDCRDKTGSMLPPEVIFQRVLERLTTLL